MKILILDIYSRNSLAVVNALDSAYTLFGGTSKGKSPTFIDKWIKSPKIHKIVRYNDSEDSIDDFKADISSICLENNIDTVIATGTKFTNLLSEIKPYLEDKCKVKVPFECYEKLSKLANKWSCYNICREIEIPTPNSLLLTSTEKAQQVCSEFRFPIITKPLNLTGSQGVCIFETPAEFMNSEQGVSNLIASDLTFIVQEHITGELHDVTLCCENGKPFSILTQHRVVTGNDFGGGGIINKTTFNSKLMNYASALVKKVNWNGILMIDFIIDSNGKPYLLECNPKFWGTTALTVEAGLNMPQQLIDVFVLNTPPGEISKVEYEKDLLYKWFPDCWFYLRSNPKKNAFKRLPKILSNHSAKRKLSNIRIGNLKHLLGTYLYNKLS